MQKRAFIFGGVFALLVIGLVVAFFVINAQHKPEKTVEIFNEAIADKDMSSLKEIIKPDKNEAQVNKASLTAFINYLNKNSESHQVIKEEFKKQIADDDFSTPTAQASLILDGKTLGMFPDYKVQIKTVNIKAKGVEEDDKLSLGVEGFKEQIREVEEEKNLYGPLIPGEYEINATLKNDLGNFTEKDKTDVWGDSEVSFLLDDEKLAENDKEIQKALIATTNEFNESMSMFLASGFDEKEFKNVTDDLKKSLGSASFEFELIKDYIEEIESKFTKSIVDMDEITLSHFDGKWSAEITMLVSYEEKLKLEDTPAEDLSYSELRKYNLKYDTDKKQWIINDIQGEETEDSEADDWENKQEIDMKNSKKHIWKEEDSFI